MSKYIFVLSIILLPLFYLNCSQNKAGTETGASDNFESESEVNSANNASESQEQSPVNNTGNTGGNNTGGSTTKLPDLDCYMDYATVFPWDNSDKDPMVEAPKVGAQKLGTLKLFNSTQTTAATLASSLSYLQNAHWKFYAIRNVKADGTSSVTAYINKFDQNDTSNELTCYFGPKFSTTGQVLAPEAQLRYQNIGVGLNGIDGFQGYLSHKDKFIACKLTKGNQDTVMYGARNNEQVTAKSFIIKRGCYQ